MKKHNLTFILCFIIGLQLSAQGNPGFMGKKISANFGFSYGFLYDKLKTIWFTPTLTLERSFGRGFSMAVSARKMNLVINEQDRYNYFDGFYYSAKTTLENYSVSGYYKTNINEFSFLVKSYRINYGALAPIGSYFKFGVGYFNSKISEDNTEAYLIKGSGPVTYVPNNPNSNTEQVGANFIFGIGNRKMITKQLGYYIDTELRLSIPDEAYRFYNKTDYFKAISYDAYRKINLFQINVGLSYAL